MTTHPAGPIQRQSRNRAPYFLLIPSLALLVIGTGYPIAWQLVTSLRKYGMAQQFGQPAEFVWLENYTDILKDPAMWGVVVRSVVFAVVVGFLTVLIGLLVALLIRQVWNWVRIVLQVALLLAWAMPVVAAMTVWIWLFDRRRGVVNWLLDAVGLSGFHRFDWLAEPLTFFLVAGVVIVWMSVPFVALSIYAALTQISEEVIEASEIDGARATQRLRFILQKGQNKTLPLWLRSFVQQSATREIDWGQVMAASTLVAIPVIVFFLIVQNRMASGLVSGAVKG